MNSPEFSAAIVRYRKMWQACGITYWCSLSTLSIQFSIMLSRKWLVVVFVELWNDFLYVYTACMEIHVSTVVFWVGPQSVHLSSWNTVH